MFSFILFSIVSRLRQPCWLEYIYFWSVGWWMCRLVSWWVSWSVDLSQLMYYNPLLLCFLTILKHFGGPQSF